VCTPSAYRWRYGCQPYAPAALFSPETFLFCLWYSFLSETQSLVRREGSGKLKKCRIVSEEIEQKNFMIAGALVEIRTQAIRNTSLKVSLQHNEPITEHRNRRLNVHVKPRFGVAESLRPEHSGRCELLSAGRARSMRSAGVRNGAQRRFELRRHVT
jgi:hypothetical protein